MLTPGNYHLEPIQEPHAQARNFFDSLEGTLITRRIDLNQVDPSRIVGLEKRPEYSPSIGIFQYKEEGERVFIYSQQIFVSDVFLNSLEKFLRENAVDIPGGPDGRYCHPNLVHYYDTPYTLLVCDISRFDFTKSSPVSKFKVIENLGSTEIFRGVDFKAGSTLRMIEPNKMEKKLREIEKDAAYMVSVDTLLDKQHISGPSSLLFYEHKDKGHFILRKP